MKFYLVSNAAATRIDLKGSALELAVPALDAKQAFTLTNISLRLQPETLPGSYRLLGFDRANLIVESSEETTAAPPSTASRCSSGRT